MKEAYYFSHDCNARHDPKISAMRSVYGALGYGWFWIIVEMMREESDHKLDMQGKYIWNAYAQQMGCTSMEDAQHFIMDCINEFQLFDSDGQFFWSKSLIKRMEKRAKVTESKIKAAEARWAKVRGEEPTIQLPSNAGSMHMHSDSNTDAIQLNESKLNQIKLNKSKENEISDDVAIVPYLTLAEEFCQLHGKGEWQLKESERSCMLELLETIPLDFILKTMKQIYEQRTAEGEKISSFAYYKNPIDNAWKGGRAHAKHQGVTQGIQSGRDSPTSRNESITGGQNGWIGRNKNNNVPLQDV